MTFEEAKLQIPIYINIKEIMELMGVSRPIASRIFTELKNENADIAIPSGKRIPLIWVIQKYGEQAMLKKPKIKDTPKS